MLDNPAREEESVSNGCNYSKTQMLHVGAKLNSNGYLRKYTTSIRQPLLTLFICAKSGINMKA